MILNHPAGGRIEVRDEHAAPYLSQGWMPERPKKATRTAPRRKTKKKEA